MNGTALLKPKSRESTGDQFNLAFISGFNLQYREMEKNIRKHWPILLKDHTLRNILPNKPKFIYRRAPESQTILAKNVTKPLRRPPTFLDRTGFFRCKRCKACKIV